MKSSRHSNYRKAATLSVIALVLLVTGVLGLVFRQEIHDAIEGFAYTPSEEIVRIQDKTQLTGAAVRVFHATAPTVADSDTFNAACQRKEALSPVVGCYTPQDAIFIYDIESGKLDGIKEVTAVHELLHAVWARMSNGERHRLSEQLQDIYERRADSDLKQRMAYYERNQKGQEGNELHSILGTEMADLGDELERHYAKYFNRSAVLKLYHGYHDSYKALEKKAASLESELNSLTESITIRSGVYEQESSRLEAEIQAFNARAAGGSFTSQAQFSRERSQLLGRVSSLENERKDINNEIGRYNDLHADYRSVVGELRALNNSVDSFKVLQPSSSVNTI